MQAKEEYNQDCMNSLVLLIKSDAHSQKVKTHAVWALGQLADKRAIPHLQEFQIDNGCKEDPKKSKLCYEILKALKWCEHGNATSWMYKNMENW